MRHSDELEAIFRKYWGQMSDQTRHLAKETVQSARRKDSEPEARTFFHEDELPWSFNSADRIRTKESEG
jgi:predicted membrane chloride channel (bestrophin family)